MNYHKKTYTKNNGSTANKHDNLVWDIQNKIIITYPDLLFATQEQIDYAILQELTKIIKDKEGLERACIHLSHIRYPRNSIEETEKRKQYRISLYTMLGKILRKRRKKK